MHFGNSTYKDLLIYKNKHIGRRENKMLTAALIGVGAATVAGVYWLVSKV